MGMAASQARLLSITARKHDVELKAQNIQNAKLALATQSDEVYEEYQKALDATTLTVQSINNGITSTVPVTFNNLFSSNRINVATGESFMLRDKRNRLVVEEEIAKGYEDFFDSSNGFQKNAQMFAMFMLGCDPAKLTGNDPNGDPITPRYVEYAAWADETSPVESVKDAYENLYNYMTDSANDWYSTEAGWDAIYDTNDLYQVGTPEEIAQYERLLHIYLNELYKTGAAERIYAAYNGDSSDGFSHNLFSYYVDMFNAIQLCGGEYISIDEFNGMNGDAANDGDWLKAMIECGMLSISTLENENGKYSLDTTTVSVEGALRYTQTSTIDKTALAKAEAKYEHDLKQIDNKDKKYDLELSKLDTERNALQTEYDSVKKVVQENIEKTFNLFS